MKRIQICHITSVHRPFDTRIFSNEICSLKKAGFELALIAPHKKTEVVDGVKIIAIPQFKKKSVRLLLASFFILRIALTLPIKYFQLHDPELVFVAIVLRIAGTKVTFDLHEKISEQVLSKPLIPKVLKGTIVVLSRWTEKIISAVSNYLIAATPVIAESCPSKKTIVIQNFPVLNVLSNLNCVPYQSRENNIIYVGDLTRVRGIKEITSAMERLPGGLDATLIIGGNFPHVDFKSEIVSLAGWSKVNFLGYIDRKTVFKQLGLARIGLVVLHPIANYVSSQPVKMYEYMNAGIPIVASDFPSWRSLIEKIGCGLLVDPLDPQSIADAIEWLLKNPEKAERMGEKGKEAVQNTYNWEVEEKKFIDFYKKIVKTVS